MESKEKILSEHGINDTVHIFSSSSLLYKNIQKAMDAHARNCMIEIIFARDAYLERIDAAMIVDGFLQSDYFKELQK